MQSPFSEGGAELHVRRLTEELVARGVEADLVTIPLIERERFDLVRSALAWRSLDVTEFGGRPVDAVVATRFPSYAVRHPNKIVWVIHQYRQAYDQFGSPWSDFTASKEDRRARETIAEIDRLGLSEARRVFANSRTVAARLRKYNGIESEPLYHPPPLVGRYRTGPPGDYALSVGRLDGWKRPDLPLRALVHAPEARLVVVGRGPEEERLKRLARELDLEPRVQWVSEAGDEALLELYAGARLVVVAPEGEDLGYVPLEAFLSGKPVLTTDDAVDLFDRVIGPAAASRDRLAVAETVQLCGHLPLAIRIAAARLRHHPVWTIDRLNRGLRTEHRRLSEQGHEDSSGSL